MSSQKKLIIVMIDGVSADYFAAHRQRMPTTSAMADEGLYVRRLSSCTPATSLPGRVSMLTGVSADQHGVYGNYIYDNGNFRAANPDDVRVRTIASLARNAGRKVACIGYTMARPDEADIFYPPWWIRGWINRRRFDAASMAGYDGPNLKIKDPRGELASHPIASMLRIESPDVANNLTKLTADLARDQMMIDAVASICSSDFPPDLVLTEISSTDGIQHLYGYESEVAHWAITAADLMIGALWCQLQMAGRHHDYNLAVVSDHGHSPIHTAIYPSVILPNVCWRSEGATLHVHAEDERQKELIVQNMSAHGVQEADNSYVPEDDRGSILSFVAPPGHGFESQAAISDDSEATGKPRYLSNHGLRPGDPRDDRLCVLYGPQIKRQVLSGATAEQFAPSMNAVMGLETSDFEASSLI